MYVLLKNQVNASTGSNIVTLQSGFSDACEKKKKKNPTDVAEKSLEGIHDTLVVYCYISKCTTQIGTVITNRLNSVGSIHNHCDKGTRGLDLILETVTRPNHKNDTSSFQQMYVMKLATSGRT